MDLDCRQALEDEVVHVAGDACALPLPLVDQPVRKGAALPLGLLQLFRVAEGVAGVFD